MGRRRAIPEDLGTDQRAVLRARWELCVLSGYAHRQRTPGAAALRELKTAHHAHPVSALGAYREALGVLDAHGEDVEAFRRDRDRYCAGHWPHTDGNELRRRIHAV